MIRANPFKAKLKAFLLPLIFAVSAAAHGQSPTAPPTPSAAATPGSYFEVPFHTENNWIILDGRLGKDFESAHESPVLHLLLDTGASVSVLSAESLERRKLSFEDFLEAPKDVRVRASGDSDMKATLRRVKATLLLTNPTGTIYQVDYVPASPLYIMTLGNYIQGAGIDGIIGDDFLRRAVFEVDFEKGRVRISDPAAFVPPSTEEGFTEMSLSFRKEDGLPFISTEITPYGFNTTAVKLTLDTGSDATLQLFAPFVARQHWQDVLPMAVPWYVGGINGKGGVYLARLRDIRFGQTELNSVPVMFSVSKLGAMATTENDGQLGCAVFKRFTVILDFPHSRIFIRPNSSAGEPFPTKWYFGIVMRLPARADGGYVLQTVWAGSPAARAGLKAGDVLYAIDGQKATAIGDEKLGVIFQVGIQMHTVEFASADGSPHRQVTMTGVAY